jgi:hypothetical protein
MTHADFHDHRDQNAEVAAQWVQQFAACFFSNTRFLILVRIAVIVTSQGPAISKILAPFVMYCSTSDCSATRPWIIPLAINRRIDNITNTGMATAHTQYFLFSPTVKFWRQMSMSWQHVLRATIRYMKIWSYMFAPEKMV